MVHEGHRGRIKKRFLDYGIDSFEPHQILEFLLFYAIPRRDTNEIAHHLLNECGSIAAVFDAPISVLKKVPGITDSAAIYLKLLPEIARIYLESKFSTKKEVFDLKKCAKLMTLKFVGRNEEHVGVMLFDAKGKMIFDGIIAKGSVNSVDICSRRIIELVSNYSACGILLAHNHPTGIAIPSSEDLSSTRALVKIFKAMNVSFLDHIIVAENDYVSLRESRIPGVFED